MGSQGGPVASGPTVERIVSEGVLSAAKIIMEARFPTVSKRKEEQQHRPWFNIEVQEVEGAAKALERWRRDGPSLPLVLEVFLQPWGAQAAGQDKVETLLERWVVHYHPQLPEGPSHLSRSQLTRLNPASVYKRLVITLRSLYTYLRVLPAYRMARACKRQRGTSFTLSYRLHSTLPGSAAAAPGARRMQSFRFGGVDTPYGQLRIGVDYQPASTVTILEQTTSPPPMPQIIADYVGGGSGGAEGGGGGGARHLRHAMSASAVGPASPVQQQQGLAAPGAGAAQHGGSPQSGPSSLGRSPGGWPIRRSWSTSLRGLSPQRTLSQPAGELPSPPAPVQDTPYGSAPQALSLPAMLRTLSSSASKYLVGSPSGRPPLAKPPRSVAGGTPGPAAGAPGRQAAGMPGGSPACGGSGGYMAAMAAAAAEEPEDEDPEMAGSPCGSAGSAGRQSSKPMCIPGRGGDGFEAGPAGRGRRLRSSNDLWALQHAAAMHKPLSAPAASHMQLPAAAAAKGAASGGQAAAGPAGASGSRFSPAGRDRMDPSPSPPPSRLPIIPGTLDSESGGSAASSLYPTSCSPQLPFAFTPSAHSLSGFGPRGSTPVLDRVSPRLAGRAAQALHGGLSMPQQAAQAQRRAVAGGAAAGSAPAGGGHGAISSTAGFSPGGGSGGGVTAREVPASTALMRRTSWSSRSSAFGPLAAEGSQPGVGYSVSPMQDPSLESMLAGSTPRHYSLAGGLPSPLTAGAPQLGPPGGPLGRAAGGSGAAAAAPPLLTYPALSPEVSGGLDEADVLPFALDEGGASSPFKPRSPASASHQPQAASGDPLPPSTGAATVLSPARHTAYSAAAGPGTAAGAAGEARPAAPATAAAPAVDADAAVGAFVRLIQEAPPLRLHGAHSARGMPGRAASADLSGLQAPPLGASSGSDSSGATCLSDGRGLTLQAGLRHFSAIRERLQQRGVMVGPCPAEA